MSLMYRGGAAVCGWVDSDYGGDKESRKATTGFDFTLNGTAVSSRGRLQKMVSTSTATAEYVAAAEVTKVSMWLRPVVGGLGEDRGPVTSHEDNRACIAMASNAGSSERTKNVDIGYHFVRDCVDRGQVKLQYVPTDKQLADGLTNALAFERFIAFREGLGVKDVTLQ